MANSRAITEKVFALAGSNGADLVGFAPVERFAHCPQDTHPQFYMEKATGVISFGIKLLDGICDIWGEYDEPGKTISPYLFYGYGLVNLELSRVALALARMLEARGYRTLLFPPTWQISLYRKYEGVLEGRMDADFSHRHAAVAAGLGEFGLNGLCLVPGAGSRIRFNSVITDAPLEAGAPYDGPPLCLPERCDQKCIRICPAEAFSENKMVHCLIGEKEYRYAAFDCIRCLYALTAMVKGSGSRSDMTIPEGPGDIMHWLYNSEQADIVDRNLREAESAGIISGYFCGKCLHSCPAPFA
ncbi:MAG TPA: hypothetical protein GX744_05835 [Firmicutes bacterium]|jgi:epoxyqueuosine reductase|nr:hypothetical protein [Bacillota bacterium]